MHRSACISESKSILITKRMFLSYIDRNSEFQFSTQVGIGSSAEQSDRCEQSGCQGRNKRNNGDLRIYGRWQYPKGRHRVTDDCRFMSHRTASASFRLRHISWHCPRYLLHSHQQGKEQTAENIAHKEASYSPDRPMKPTARAQVWQPVRRYQFAKRPCSNIYTCHIGHYAFLAP